MTNEAPKLSTYFHQALIGFGAGRTLGCSQGHCPVPSTNSQR